MPRISRLFHAATLLLLISSVPLDAQTVDGEVQLRGFEQKIEQGKYAEVEGALMKFVIANQDSPRAYLALARVRFNQDRLTEARGLYQKALAFDPNLVSTRLELAVVALRLNLRDEGLQHLDALTAGKLSNEHRLKLAQTFVMFGEFRAALNTVSGLPQQMQNEAALPIRAICHLELRDDDKVAGLVRTARRLAVKSPGLVVKFAEPLAGTRFNRDAMTVLRSVVAAHPKNVGALLLLAKVEMNAGELASAKTRVRQAAVLAPGSAEVAFAEALLAKEQGDPKATLAHLEKSLLKAPDSIRVMREIVLAAMRAHQPPRAIEVARKLMDLQPSEPEFVYLYGAATLQIGRFTEAEEYLTKYVGIRPQDSRGCVALGISLISQPAKLSAGQIRLEQCIRDHPTNFEAAFQLGLSFKENGESEKAMELFERSLRISPEFVPGLRELGTLQLQAGDAVKARESLEKAVAIDPNDANTHFQLSRLFNLAGEAERAKVHFDMYRRLRVTN